MSFEVQHYLFDFLVNEEDAATSSWLFHPELFFKIVSVCLHSGMMKNKDK